MPRALLGCPHTMPLLPAAPHPWADHWLPDSHHLACGCGTMAPLVALSPAACLLRRPKEASHCAFEAHGELALLTRGPPAEVTPLTHLLHLPARQPLLAQGQAAPAQGLPAVPAARLLDPL